jgi:hypothetical protein
MATWMHSRLRGRTRVACLERVPGQRCTGRAGTRIPSEALHRMLPSDVLPRFARERVPSIASASPNQIVKPTDLFAETMLIRSRSGSNPRYNRPSSRANALKNTNSKISFINLVQEASWIAPSNVGPQLPQLPQPGLQESAATTGQQCSRQTRH